MKHLWRILNIGLVALALFGGYISMSPERLRKTNPDAILCLILLVLMPLFALGSVYYSIRRSGCGKLRRPSWDRHAINWWHDPLQSLFVSNCLTTALAVGSAFHLPASGSFGFWTFAMYSCLAVGLAVGQLIVYKIYRGHIIEA